jgi:hypothetical protein
MRSRICVFHGSVKLTENKRDMQALEMEEALIYFHDLHRPEVKRLNFKACHIRKWHRIPLQVQPYGFSLVHRTTEQIHPDRASLGCRAPSYHPPFEGCVFDNLI